MARKATVEVGCYVDLLIVVGGRDRVIVFGS